MLTSRDHDFEACSARDALYAPECVPRGQHGMRRIVTRDVDFHRFALVEVIDPLRD